MGHRFSCLFRLRSPIVRKKVRLFSAVRSLEGRLIRNVSCRGVASPNQEPGFRNALKQLRDGVQDSGEIQVPIPAVAVIPAVLGTSKAIFAASSRAERRKLSRQPAALLITLFSF